MINRSCSGHLYEVLEVEQNAPTETIRRQYKKMALRYHPDRNNGTTGEQFQEIEEAHRILSDPSKRSLYDTIGRDNMKRIGDDPFMELILNNSGLLHTVVGTVVTLLGLLLVGLILFFYRFDRQFAVSNQGKPGSFSWWICSLPIWPTTLCFAIARAVQAKQNFQEGGSEVIISILHCVFSPVYLIVIIATLNGQLSLSIAIISLAVAFLVQGFQEWQSIPVHMGGDATASFCQKACLQTVFFILLFIRVRQDGPAFISMWLVFLPLLILTVLGFRGNAWSSAAKLYVLLFWTQKLNTEFNNHRGYDPRAFTASLPIFLGVSALFIVVVVLGIFFVSNRRNEHNDEQQEEQFPV